MCRQKIYIQLVYFSYDLKDSPEKEDFHSTVNSFQKTSHEIKKLVYRDNTYAQYYANSTIVSCLGLVFKCMYNDLLKKIVQEGQFFEKVKIRLKKLDKFKT